MGNSTTGSGAHIGRRCDWSPYETPVQDNRPSGGNTEAANGRAVLVVGDVNYATAINAGRATAGARMIPWVKTLIKVWRGELEREEKEETAKAHEEARRSIECGKAMLDGEEYWLVREDKRGSYGGEED